jgi:hypothetical protein
MAKTWIHGTPCRKRLRPGLARALESEQRRWVTRIKVKEKVLAIRDILVVTR